MSQRELNIIANLRDNVSGQLKGIEGNIQRMQPQFRKMAGIGTAGFAVVSGAVIGLSNKYATMGDEIAKTSTKLGVSTDSLQEMHYWASQNGISSSALERGVGRLNQRIGRAIDGNDKYTEAFEALNVKLKDGEGNIRNTDDVMKETVSTLRDIEDPAIRSARASEIFGTRMARDLMPALEDGSISLEEATKRIHEMGGVMDEEATRAAEDYKDTMDDLQRVVGSVGSEFANIFIPILTDLAEKLQPIIQRVSEWIKENPELVRHIIIAAAALAGLVAGVGLLGIALPAIITGFKLLLGPLGIALVIFAGLAAMVWKNRDAIMPLIKDGLEKLKEIWEKILPVLQNAWDGLQKIWKVIGGPIKKAFGDLITQLKMIWEDFKKLWDIISPTILPLLKYLAIIIGTVLVMSIMALLIILAKLAQFVVAVMQVFIKAFTAIVEHVRDFWLKNIIEVFQKAGSAWMEVWEGIREVVRTIINAMIGYVEGWVNGFIEGINSIIRAIRSLARIAERVGINIPTPRFIKELRLPRLHDGGFINAPASQEFPAILRGQEAVVPLDKMGFGGITVNVYGDVSGDELIEKVKRGIMGELKHNMAI